MTYDLRSLVKMTIVLFCCCSALNLNGQVPEKVFPGADELSPSRAQYFSWINNTNEGPTEKQTLINLDFFRWLHDEYGMVLDIYAFDAGAIDGKRFYGSVQSERFKKQFPNGFDPIYKKAKAMNTRLGVWGGPDGFGDTAAEQKERIDQMVGLCKDYEFALFKFDAVCGQLRPEKELAFIEMMTKSRQYSPDLILLNHRLGLKEGKAHATTFLWEGAETYTGVWSVNTSTAPHHRAGALGRGLTPELKRLTEDHGVCLSSYLDYWADELILQAFNRSLILAPEIYGNPWLLPDADYPKLARIYNLHRQYRTILVHGIVLPEENYGPYAMSRGNEQQRFISLRNLTWTDAIYTIRLDEEIGLKKGTSIELRQYHPTERIIGEFKYGETLSILVPPFRSSLLYAGTPLDQEPGVRGVNYEVLRQVAGKSTKMTLLGLPGTAADIQLTGAKNWNSVWLNGQEQKELKKGQSISIQFPGTPLQTPYHRKLASFQSINIPEDVEALYEATVFAADNNALEVRALAQSGWSAIPEVRRAQEAFFQQETFVNRGIWDKNLFDGDRNTAFNSTQKYRVEQKVKGGCFRLDLGAITDLETLKIIVDNEYELQPQLIGEGNWLEYSSDLIHWKKMIYIADPEASISFKEPFRYLKIAYAPQRIVEIEGFKNGQAVDRNQWRASNLFAPVEKMETQKVWTANFTPQEVPKGSYLCIALEGTHGIEGAYAAAKINNQYIGCPDRATAYPSNTWEYVNARSDKNYTYYLPLTKEMIGQKIELFVMGYQKEHLDFQPELWITTAAIPFEKMDLEIR